MNPADIEITSMEIIENELYKMGAEFPKEILAVVKRVIHTSADFEYVKNIYFSENAVD